MYHCANKIRKVCVALLRRNNMVRNSNELKGVVTFPLPPPVFHGTLSVDPSLYLARLWATGYRLGTAIAINRL